MCRNNRTLFNLEPQVELMKHEAAEGRPYGKMTFRATGEEGIVVLEWSPVRGAF
jgi:hypothetical protein